MDNTMGKRIMQHRKRLGLTQDQLAERLGVTAQAVSKWENDQTCPDISTLPRLADIFGCTTDALLGRESTAPIPQESAEDAEKEGIHVDVDGWEMHWSGGRRHALTLAIAVFITGALALAAQPLQWDADLWDILWPTFLLCFGVSGSCRRFSFWWVCLTLTGAYFLIQNLGFLPDGVNRNLLLPVLVLLLGLSLLLNALKEPRSSRIRFHRGPKTHGMSYLNAEDFTYNASFGTGAEAVSLSRLHKGRVSVSFGEYTLDLTEVEELSQDCVLEASCSFGELSILVPKHFGVRPVNSVAFADICTEGEPNGTVAGWMTLKASASFGNITVQYV